MTTLHEGDTLRTESAEWTRACNCDATAALDALRLVNDDAPGWRQKPSVTYHVRRVPGPSCNGCGKPWRLASRNGGLEVFA